MCASHTKHGTRPALRISFAPSRMRRGRSDAHGMCCGWCRSSPCRILGPVKDRYRGSLVCCFAVDCSRPCFRDDMLLILVSTSVSWVCRCTTADRQRSSFSRLGSHPRTRLYICFVRSRLSLISGPELIQKSKHPVYLPNTFWVWVTDHHRVSGFAETSTFSTWRSTVSSTSRCSSPPSVAPGCGASGSASISQASGLLVVPDASSTHHRRRHRTGASTVEGSDSIVKRSQVIVGLYKEVKCLGGYRISQEQIPESPFVLLATARNIRMYTCIYVRLMTDILAFDHSLGTGAAASPQMPAKGLSQVGNYCSFQKHYFKR